MDVFQTAALKAGRAVEGDVGLKCKSCSGVFRHDDGGHTYNLYRCFPFSDHDAESSFSSQCDLDRINRGTTSASPALPCLSV